MTKKRKVKLFMALGFDRNEAKKHAKNGVEFPSMVACGMTSKEYGRYLYSMSWEYFLECFHRREQNEEKEKNQAADGPRPWPE